jgi:hypothetical protein
MIGRAKSTIRRVVRSLVALLQYKRKNFRMPSQGYLVQHDFQSELSLRTEPAEQFSLVKLQTVQPSSNSQQFGPLKAEQFSLVTVVEMI